jgi:O-antigen/teichoic acid export membrane protein
MSVQSIGPQPQVAEGDVPATATGRSRRLGVNVLAGGVANFLKIGVQLVMLPLMAHLLGPSEFGLYALALPTISFFMILADGGLAASLARERTDRPIVWSTAFWLMLMVGFALAAVVVGWGFILGALSNEPRVTSLMAILSVSVVMIGVSALPAARLTREGRLVVFAVADISSTIFAACIAIGFAASGTGAMSLAIQYVTYYTARAAILNASAFVRPGFEFQLSAIAGHLSMGSSLLSTKLSDFSGRLIENLLYGRAFGAAGLGVFTFANQAPRFVCEAAAGPVWAALYSHALHERDGSIARTHANLARLLATIVFPAAALIAATAPQIVAIILGPKWDAAAGLLRILIPFYALNVVASQSGAVLLARGRGWLLFWLSLLLTAGRVAAVAMGPSIGESGVAFGIGAALSVFAALMFQAPGAVEGRRDWSLLLAIVPPVAASMAAGLVCWFVASLASSGILWIAFSWAAGGLVYLVILFALQGTTLLHDLTALRAIATRATLRSV